MIGDSTADRPGHVHAHQVSERIGPGSVSVVRTGARTYEGLNERGSTVRIGPADAEDCFTPGELLKLALIGCAGMSADRVTARCLGDDFAMTIWAHGRSDHDENRYRRIEEEVRDIRTAPTPVDTDDEGAGLEGPTPCRFRSGRTRTSEGVT